MLRYEIPLCNAARPKHNDCRFLLRELIWLGVAGLSDFARFHAHFAMRVGDEDGINALV